MQDKRSDIAEEAKRKGRKSKQEKQIRRIRLHKKLNKTFKGSVQDDANLVKE